MGGQTLIPFRYPYYNRTKEAAETLDNFVQHYYNKKFKYYKDIHHILVPHRSHAKKINLNVETHSIESLLLKVKYPRILNLKNIEIQENINKSIEMLMGKLIQDQYVKWKEFDEVIINGLYDLPLNCNGLLSILFEHYSYGYGTNHGKTLVKSLNIDIFTGKEFKFSDLFNKNSPYEHRLNDFIKKEILFKDPPILCKMPTVTDNQCFCLSKEYLTIFFPIEEYTSTNYGVLKFQVPMNLLLDLIDIKGPLGRLIS